MQLHLIWDFDGTLYDTYPQMAQTLCDALADLGRQADPAEAYALIKRTVFFAIREYAVRYNLPAETLQEGFFRRHMQDTVFPPMPGMMDCLRQASRMGCRHYLFTHRGYLAKAQLAADGLDSLFVDAVTHEDGFPDKPAPDAILHLMKKHGFTAGDALMVGDRDIDILSGRAAGTRGILMDPDGYYRKTAVNFRVQTLTEIPVLLRKLEAEREAPRP